jgi:hypothetical protein
MAFVLALIGLVADVIQIVSLVDSLAPKQDKDSLSVVRVGVGLDNSENTSYNLLDFIAWLTTVFHRFR